MNPTCDYIAGSNKHNESQKKNVHAICLGNGTKNANKLSTNSLTMCPPIVKYIAN